MLALGWSWSSCERGSVAVAVRFAGRSISFPLACVLWVCALASGSACGGLATQRGEDDGSEGAGGARFGHSGSGNSGNRNSGSGSGPSGVGGSGDLVEFRCGEEGGHGPDADGDGRADSTRSPDFPIDPLECHILGSQTGSAPDCDDTDPELFYLVFEDRDGDTWGDLAYPACVGQKKELTQQYNSADCDDTDPMAFELHKRDADGDGFAGDERLCGSSTAPAGYLDSGHPGPRDCDDASEDVHPGGVDFPGDNVDGNCDGVDGVDQSQLHEFVTSDLAERTVLPVGCAYDSDVYVVAAAGEPLCGFQASERGTWYVELGNRGYHPSQGVELVVTGANEEWRFSVPPIPAESTMDLISLGPLPVEVTMHFELPNQTSCSAFVGEFESYAGCTVP